MSDTERWAVDARLQQAVGDGLLTLPEYEERSGAVWSARTRRDLEGVTRDLPGPVAAAPPPVTAAGPAPRARRAIAVMSGDELRGPVAPGQAVEAYTLMGGALIDLQRDDLPSHVRVRAVAVMGGIEVRVPRGVEVHLSGMSLMGGRELRLDPPRPGAPVVEVAAYALMGGVEVKHGREVRRDGLPDAAPALPAPRPSPAPPLVASGSQQVVSAHSRALRHTRRRGPRRLLVGLVLAAVLFGGGSALTASDAGAVFGSTERTVTPGETGVDVGVLFGSVRVVVPDGTTVTTSGAVVFGSTECDACDAAAAGPTVDVHRAGAFGSVEIVTQSQADAERERPPALLPLPD